MNNFNIVFNKFNKEIYDKLILPKNCHLFIDGSNLYHMNYFRSRELENKNGEPTGPFFGFIRSFILLLDRFYPKIENVHVFWDKGRSIRNLNLDADYKKSRDEQRSKLAAEDPEKAKREHKTFVDNRNKSQEFINHLGIKQYIIENVEGDLVLSYVLKDFLKKELQNDIAIIISNDTDFYQLLSFYPKVVIWNNIRKTYVTPENMINLFLNKWEKTSIPYATPIQVMLSKCISGDNSDNIEGLKGIGKIKSLKFLLEYYPNATTVDEIIKNIEKKPFINKMEKLILDNQTRIETNYQLINLMTPERYISDTVKDMIKEVMNKNEIELNISKCYDLLTWCNCGTIIQKFPLFLQNYYSYKVANQSDELNFDDNFEIAV